MKKLLIHDSVKKLKNFDNCVVVCVYCRNCKPPFLVNFTYLHAIYCSMKCSDTNMKNRKAGIYDFDSQSAGGKAGAAICKRKKTGLYDSKIHYMGTSIGGKAGAVTCKKEKLGVFFNPKIKKEICSLGGLSAQKTLRRNIRNLYCQANYYDSKAEIEIYLCLKAQFKYEPQDNKTLHVNVGNFEYDYLLNRIFIEYHPWDLKFTSLQYYNRRRKNLDKNGYKNYSLIVIE